MSSLQNGYNLERTKVNSRLKYIQNWPVLAEEASWSASELATRCGVSLRTLERFFLKTIGKAPKVWLTESRLQKAEGLLRNGSTIKETASQLAYKHAHHFSREFKQYWGYGPASLPASSRPETRFCRVSV